MHAGDEAQDTLAARSEEWLEHLREQRRSPHTVTTYASALLHLRRHLSAKNIFNLRDVTAGALREWQRALAATCATATQDQFLRIVRFWFQWLHERSVLFENPAEGLRGPNLTQPLTRCPSEEQMRQVLRRTRTGSAVGLRDLAVLELAYASGARLAELAALKLSSLNLAQRVILLDGKGRRQRVVPLTRKSVQVLRRYLTAARPALANESEATDALFLSARGGGPLERPGVSQIVRRAGERAGIELTPHDIRRAFATHLLRGGANPAVVRELLGHSSYRHLARYLRLKLELPESPAYRRRFQ